MAAPTLEHFAFTHLEETPSIVRALLSGVTEEQAYWKPSPGRFSIAEVLEHMSHIEAHYFRNRFDQMMAVDNPEFEPYDTNAFFAAGTYSGREAEESMAHWEEQRDDNLEFLKDLDPIVLSRRGRHTVLGAFTLEHILNEWALHDLGHIRQLAELVRTQLYFPNLGPFQADYVPKP